MKEQKVTLKKDNGLTRNLTDSEIQSLREEMRLASEKARAYYQIKKVLEKALQSETLEFD